MVPRCLKSESEERETWTAESLRAAFSMGKNFLWAAALEETSAVFTFQGTSLTRLLFGLAPKCASDQGGPRQAQTTSREKVLIQLESLILAQSERWRQA
jgi:hypothetical protein